MKWLALFISLLLSSATYPQPLLIGAPPLNPPFEVAADMRDHFFGFDIDIMSEVCKRLNQECEFLPLIYHDLFAQLRDQKIDLAIGAIIITPERQQDFLTSLPYLTSYAQFITTRLSPIQTIPDINNKKVGVLHGSLFENLLYQQFTNVTLIEYPSIPMAFEGLKNNEIDILITNASSAEYWFASNSNEYKLIGEKIPYGIGFGILANKAQTDLINNINAALIAMEQDGAYLRIYSCYF